jgi:integrase
MTVKFMAGIGEVSICHLAKSTGRDFSATAALLLAQRLVKAGLHRRGPHQMRRTFGWLFINVGDPVTYVSR